MQGGLDPIVRSFRPRAWARWCLIFCLAGWSNALWAELPDFRGILDQAREASYRDHWQRAQTMLEELAPLIDQAGQREQVDFHLLEARHLVLADRSEEGLARVAEVLTLDLPDDQRLRALQLSANVGVLLRQYERAFEYLGEALAIRVDPEDPAPRIASLNMASYMLGRVGEFEMGLEYGLQALALARRTGSLAEACVALQRLAPVYKWAGRAADSEQAYRDGIDDCAKVGNALFVGVLQHGLADLLRQQGRAEEALALAESAIAALASSVYPLGEFEARLVRAETLQTLGELSRIQEEELLRLANYFGERELWDQAARLEVLKAALAEAAGNFDQAVVHLRRYLAARESFLGRERSMRLAYLQVEFNSRFQQQELELLRETARVAQLETQTAVQQRRLRTLGWLSIGMAFLLLFALLFRVFRSRRRFRELSRQDRLSGLANHSWFFERAQKLIDASVGEQTQGLLVLVVADIDHFKRVNDLYGHQVGDAVLGRTARRLREVFPDQTLVGRIGGEEFAVLIRADSLKQVLDCIDQFRRPESESVRAGDPEVTVSFGVSWLRPGDNIETLRERADRALYRAKQAGRDRVEMDAD